jgi:very-short-patch-repair endonuclease
MYENLSDDKKIEIINKEYIENKKSFQIIAKEYSTYANKIRRDAKRLGVNVRSKSEAQSNAISVGTHKHPTKGTERSSETKHKIGLSILENWKNLSDEDLDSRKEKARDNWNKKSEDEKQEMISKANRAVRESSKLGSKLEKYLLVKLIEDGHKVDFHKEHILSNTKLQIDLFLPNINLAIEVDGPSHFENIWGDQSLSRNQKYDLKKEGLLIGKGISILRVKQSCDFSETRAYLLYQNIKPFLIKNMQSNKNIVEY